MNKEQLYQEHLDLMFGTTTLENLSESIVDDIITRIIDFLPNNGKLYKYRSIEGESFDYAYDGLKNGYLYMARANTLNDDFDSTLNFDAEKDANKQMELFLEKPWLYLEALVRENCKQRQIFLSPYDKEAYQMLMSCVNNESYELDREKAINVFSQIGIDRQTSENYINKVLETVENEIRNNAENLKKPLSALINFNNESRKDIYIFSMSEDYDSDTMWAYYANSNKGFCIEYDYDKVKDLPFDKKKLLISLYKVVYKDNFDEYSFSDMLQYYLGGKKDDELLKRANMQTLTAMITKLSRWKEEKEWRIFLFNLDEKNKIFADIVSGLILDERIMHSENGIKLLNLAKERNWSVTIRKRTRIGTGHLYKNIVHNPSFFLKRL